MGVVFSRGFLLATLLVALGVSSCANIRVRGPEYGSSAIAQESASQGIESFSRSLAPILSGRSVSVGITGPSTPIAAYLREAIREQAVLSGGAYREDSDSDVRIELMTVTQGTQMVERSLIVPIGQYVRIPAYYGEHYTDDTRVFLRAFDRAGGLMALPSNGEASQRVEMYILRAIGVSVR